MDDMRMKRQDKCERLEPCGVMNEFSQRNYRLRAVCSILHVAHVGVILVHNGLNEVEGVLVIIHTST